MIKVKGASLSPCVLSAPFSNSPFSIGNSHVSLRQLLFFHTNSKQQGPSELVQSISKHLENWGR